MTKRPKNSDAMKQPETAALRERLANYTPEDELEQDKQELEGLFQEVNCQMVELRNLLGEINALKEELHGIHGSLTDTQTKNIGVRIHPDTMKALNEVCNDFVVEVGKQLMAHRDKQLEQQKVYEARLTRMLEQNKGVWLSDRWMKVLLVCFLLYFLISFIYVCYSS